jgi:hypothetical protein
MAFLPVGHIRKGRLAAGNMGNDSPAVKSVPLKTALRRPCRGEKTGRQPGLHPTTLLSCKFANLSVRVYYGWNSGRWGIKTSLRQAAHFRSRLVPSKTCSTRDLFTKGLPTKPRADTSRPAGYQVRCRVCAKYAPSKRFIASCATTSKAPHTENAKLGRQRRPSGRRNA